MIKLVVIKDRAVTNVLCIRVGQATLLDLPDDWCQGVMRNVVRGLPPLT